MHDLESNKNLHARAPRDDHGLAAVGCVEIKILRRVLLNPRVDLRAIDATPWLISTQVLGDRGVHARSAVGTNALPLGVPVEIEAVVEVEAGS